jgi:hypothetical protein
MGSQHSAPPGDCCSVFVLLALMGSQHCSATRWQQQTVSGKLLWRHAIMLQKCVALPDVSGCTALLILRGAICTVWRVQCAFGAQVCAERGGSRCTLLLLLLLSLLASLSWGPPSRLYSGYRVYFPGVNRPRRGTDRPPLAPRLKQ